MADEYEESFVPAYKKYKEMQEAIVETSPGPYIESIVKRLARMRKLVPKMEKTGEVSAAIPSRLGRLKNRLGEKFRNVVYGGMKTRLKPAYSTEESKEREELRGALGELEEYNPAESKGPGLLKKLKPYAETLFGKRGGREEKLSDYLELADTGAGEPNVAVEDRESLKKALGGLEHYAPGEEIPYGEEYPKSAKAAGAEVYVKRIHGKYKDRPLPASGVEVKDADFGKKAVRKSYSEEAYTDKLLGRSRINDLSQYVPEHVGRYAKKAVLKKVEK